ncbi:MAG TPA: N-acetyl-gamma-glutamyl-phosphate reductase [Streptosporangiaceae bacterium]|nr:N-acetyl-gamma-glutamyl-phosphate reductase [Streptosporangiaceae bacterium]
MSGRALRATVVGGTGYVGGELLRLLLGHPRVEVAAATSTRLAGRRIDTAHPNLRGVSDLAFVAPDEAGETDVLLLAMPHRQTMDRLPSLLGSAKHIIDLSADFRLRDPAVYARYYGVPHSAPDLIGAFVPGLAERYRAELGDADLISVPGCMATAGILALAPLAELLDGPVEIDARSGSSGAGAGAGETNLHAERSGAMRVFAPTSHRHQAEIAQETGLEVRMSATGVEAVRGVQLLCHGTLASGIGETQVRQAYRRAYKDEPFVRIVAHRRGSYRFPEPKILLGSNFCDVGFAVEPGDQRLVVIAALDNLVKGAAGAAVQCLNIRLGWPERLGLEFPGLHPN